MIDPYYIKLKGFDWSMSLKQIDEIELEVGPAVSYTRIFIDGIEKNLYLLESNKNKDVRLEVQGFDKNGKIKVQKKYGVKILADRESNQDEPERENVFKDYYPKGEIVEIGMPVRWVKEPRGLIVHFTAGWSNKESNAVRTLQGGKKNGYTYWSMSESGQVYMDTKATEHGYHSGSYHHRDHLGLEICNGGKLTKKNGVCKTWFNYTPPQDRIRFVKYEGQVEGFYMTYTKEQVQSLIDVCMWLKETYPSFSFDRVIGHDEAMVEIGKPGRKNDPGGALPMSMSEFRALLKQTYLNLS